METSTKTGTAGREFDMTPNRPQGTPVSIVSVKSSQAKATDKSIGKCVWSA